MKGSVRFDKEEWEESLRQEMKERGLKEGVLKIAKNLKIKNYSENEIMEITGLSIDKIKKL